MASMKLLSFGPIPLLNHSAVPVGINSRPTGAGRVNTGDSLRRSDAQLIGGSPHLTSGGTGAPEVLRRCVGVEVWRCGGEVHLATGAT